MGRKIKVEAVWRKEPEIGLYVLALIALVRQLQEEEERAAAQQAPIDSDEKEAGND
jgi:hypothetical protein